MPYFRKKPVTIEARQFNNNNEPEDKQMNELCEWVNSQSQVGNVASHNSTDIFIHTLEGIHRALCGDWIIKGVQGEFYPCKPDIFQETYEPTQEREPTP